MTAFVHTLSDGMELTVEIKRRAKKNLIIRPAGTHTVRISVPPCFSVSALNRWLYENEAVLRQTLAKTPPPQTAENGCPNPSSSTADSLPSPPIKTRKSC